MDLLLGKRGRDRVLFAPRAHATSPPRQSIGRRKLLVADRADKVVALSLGLETLLTNPGPAAVRARRVLATVRDAHALAAPHLCAARMLALLLRATVCDAETLALDSF